MGLLKKYFIYRRGGQLKCRLTGGYANPPLQLNRRLYSAPTVFMNYMAHSGSICAMTILFQQP